MVGVLEVVLLAAVAGFDVYSYSKFKETEKEVAELKKLREGDLHAKLDSIKNSVSADHETQNTALLRLSDDLSSLRGAKIAGVPETNIHVLSSAAAPSAPAEPAQGIYTSYSIQNAPDEVKTMTENEDYYAFRGRNPAAYPAGAPALGESTTIRPDASRLESRMDSLQAELQSIRSSVSEVSGLEQKLADVKSELRTEFSTSLEDLRNRIAQGGEGPSAGSVDLLRKKVKTLGERMLEVDNRIDAQLIGSVIDSKMMDEKIKAARSDIAKEIAEKYGQEGAAKIRDELRGEFTAILEAAMKTVATEKSLANARKEMRVLGRSIADVDNRIDRQLIGNVVDAKVMDEKIKDAEKRILALVAEKAAAANAKAKATVKAIAPAAKAANAANPAKAPKAKVTKAKRA